MDSRRLLIHHPNQRRGNAANHLQERGRAAHRHGFHGPQKAGDLGSPANRKPGFHRGKIPDGRTARSGNQKNRERGRSLPGRIRRALGGDLAQLRSLRRDSRKLGPSDRSEGQGGLMGGKIEITGRQAVVLYDFLGAKAKISASDKMRLGRLLAPAPSIHFHPVG